VNEKMKPLKLNYHLHLLAILYIKKSCLIMFSPQAFQQQESIHVNFQDGAAVEESFENVSVLHI
jgi:hypothetical protein